MSAEKGNKPKRKAIVFQQSLVLRESNLQVQLETYCQFSQLTPPRLDLSLRTVLCHEDAQCIHQWRQEAFCFGVGVFHVDSFEKKQQVTWSVERVRSGTCVRVFGELRVT